MCNNRTVINILLFRARSLKLLRNQRGDSPRVVHVILMFNILQLNTSKVKEPNFPGRLSDHRKI